MSVATGFAERGLAPDFAIRVGIRGLLADRLRQEATAQRTDAFADSLRSAPIALVPDRANQQHYEVPADFFEQVLGKHRKYSCAWWDEGTRRLDEAEARMLELTCERAQVVDGQTILELGCGWGALSLWMAERYPSTRIVAVSNSAIQRKYIADRAPANLEVITADMNDFTTALRFDRVVSVEMFEHMRNWPALLERVAGWLTPGGKLFVHVFCHREFAYPFEAEGDADWMAEHFFTGGMMPSWDLLPRFQDHLALEEQWQVDGTHYQKTVEAWLKRFDARRGTIRPVLAETYGADQAERWLHRWRMFFLACSELFGYKDGTEWFVGQYRMVRR